MSMLFIKRCYANVTASVDVKAISHDIKYAIRDSKSPDGLLTVVIPQSGAGLVVMPAIPEAMEELKTTMDMFGAEAGSARDALKRERDIGPIIQSALLGRTVHLPFTDSKLILDPYDEVLLVDFEKKVGRREFVIQIVSEAPSAEAPKKGPQKSQPGGTRRA